MKLCNLPDHNRLSLNALWAKLSSSYDGSSFQRDAKNNAMYLTIVMIANNPRT